MAKDLAQKMLLRLVSVDTSFLWPFRALILNTDLFLACRLF